MANLKSDFLAALRTLKATGETQHVGSFQISNESTQFGVGLRIVQACLRVDPLGYQAPFCSHVTGGYRYWPASDSGLRKVAERLFKREEEEAATRRLHLSAA